MEDRELLELAAKAAGIKLYWEPCLTNAGKIFRPHLEIGGTWGHGEWNPLEDDGDALRLAVALGLRLDIDPCGTWTMKKDICFLTAKESAPSPEAVTRLAVVRAAAAIGRRAA